MGNSETAAAPGGRDGTREDVAFLLRLLGTAWLLEPDQSVLDRLALLPGMAKACRETIPSRAALEYSRIILQLVPPYASLFLDEDAMLNSAQAERVERLYRQAGFAIPDTWRAGPADHLGIELHFLAHLLAHHPDKHAAFLEDAVLPWAPVCLLAISRIESGRFYPALATATLDILRSLD